MLAFFNLGVQEVIILLLIGLGMLGALITVGIIIVLSNRGKKRHDSGEE